MKCVPYFRCPAGVRVRVRHGRVVWMYASEKFRALMSGTGFRAFTSEFRRFRAHSGTLDPMVHSGLLEGDALPVIKGSKSEVLFCAKPLHMYMDPASLDDTDLSPILLPNHGYMPVVDRFPYLGDYISRDGSDEVAVDARIESGSKAFGALRTCIFSSSAITNEAKRAVYTAIVLSITLFGCETWSLTETLLHRLRGMHAQHLRAMCRVTRTHVWKHHLSTQELGQRLGLESIDMEIARRQLRWAGHVSRMDYESRLPRRMLSSWVPHPRPVGAPMMTYGRSLFKAMDKLQLDAARWHELAGDRSAWRTMLRTGLAPPAFRPQTQPPSPRIARMKPVRSCARATVAAIDVVLQRERMMGCSPHV